MTDTTTAPAAAPKSPRLKMPFAGGDWISANIRLREGTPYRISDLGFRVAEALGYAFAGIYHLSHSALFHPRTDWRHERRVLVVIGNRLANRDGNELALLLTACAALGLRVELRGRGNGYVGLTFCRMGQFYGGVEPFVESFELPHLPAVIPGE